MVTPTLTVVTAHGGTESDGSSSIAGHMYYVLNDGYGNITSYGFAPVTEHSMAGLGVVNPNIVGVNSDMAHYAGLTSSSYTVNISQSQFNTLASFGANPAAFNFNLNYNIITKSCVDFVWAGLAAIGISDPTHIPGTELTPNSKCFICR